MISYTVQTTEPKYYLHHVLTRGPVHMFKRITIENKNKTVLSANFFRIYFTFIAGMPFNQYKKKTNNFNNFIKRLLLGRACVKERFFLAGQGACACTLIPSITSRGLRVLMSMKYLGFL